MTKTRMGEILDKYVKLLTLNCKKKINYYTEDKKISTQGYTKYRDKIFALKKVPVLTLEQAQTHNIYQTSFQWYLWIHTLHK